MSHSHTIIAPDLPALAPASPPAALSWIAMSKLSEEKSEEKPKEKKAFIEDKLETLSYTYGRFFDVQNNTIHYRSSRSMDYVREPNIYRGIDSLNHEGRCLLAYYYKQKYNIDIFVINGITHLKSFISQKTRLQKEDCVRLNFVLRIKSKHSHSVPIIYEKKAERESFIILDSVDAGETLRSQLVTAGIFPANNPVVYQNQGLRQVDSQSCGADAFAILKDVALFVRQKSLSTLTDLIMPAAILDEKFKVARFRLPHELLKVVQYEKYFKNETIPATAVVVRSRPDKPPLTLLEHKKKYTKTIQVARYYQNADGMYINPFFSDGEENFIDFNTFLWEKGRKNGLRLDRTYKHLAVKAQTNHTTTLQMLYEVYNTHGNLTYPPQFEMEIEKAYLSKKRPALVFTGLFGNPVNIKRKQEKFAADCEVIEQIAKAETLDKKKKIASDFIYSNRDKTLSKVMKKNGFAKR